MRKIVIEIIGTLLAGVVIYILFSISVQYSVVDGSSMLPSLHDGQRLLINKIAYSNPQRGDIVIFDAPYLDNDIIHRIVGLPGEEVEMRAGEVYINGQKLEEPYAQGHSISRATEVVPENHYYVVGDNRSASRIDVVPYEDIVGKAWLSVWPPSEWGLAPNYELQLEPDDQTFVLPNAEAEPVAG